MKNDMFEYAVLGGDMRQVWMAEMLADQGKRVICCGVDRDGFAGKTVIQETASMKEALQAKIIIGPIPFSIDGKTIRQKRVVKEMQLKDLEQLLQPGQYLFGGVIPVGIKKICREKNISCYDFMEQEEVAIYNSIATAEGTIAEMIKNYPGNLHGSKVLMVGYGRCAKTLADKLKGMSARVTICARNPVQREWAETFGYEAISFDQVEDRLLEFPLIINTIPAVCFPERVLRLTRPDTMIFDIASAPGGVDFEAAAGLGRFAKLYPGLPGVYAPKASAEILQQFIERIYEKE